MGSKGVVVDGIGIAFNHSMNVCIYKAKKV